MCIRDRLQAEQPHIAFEDADEGAEAFVATVARQLVGDGRAVSYTHLDVYKRQPLGGGRKPVGPGRPPHILMATQEPHRLPETLLSPPVLWVRRREKAFSQKRKAVFEDGTESGSIVVKYGLIIWCFR